MYLNYINQIQFIIIHNNNIIIRNDQTILELAMSSKNVASDMVPVERTLLVIGSKNAVSIHTIIIVYKNIKIIKNFAMKLKKTKKYYLNRVKHITCIRL